MLIIGIKVWQEQDQMLFEKTVVGTPATSAEAAAAMKMTQVLGKAFEEYQKAVAEYVATLPQPDPAPPIEENHKKKRRRT